jgi:hypothetical protein
MVKTLKIGGGEVILAANAATPYRYKNLFHEDLFRIFSDTQGKSEAENISLTDTVMKLCFVMAKQAEKADMSMLSEDDFITWLEGYDPMDIVLVGEDIINLYMGSTKGSIDPKKK